MSDTVLYNEKGELHNDNGPAIVTPHRIAHYINGVMTQEYLLKAGNWVSTQIKPVAAPYQHTEKVDKIDKPVKHRKLLTEAHIDDGN